MQVNSYIFQSPYSSQVQVGRPDATSNSEQKTTQPDTSGLNKAINQPQESAQAFKSTQVEEVKPTVDVNSSLDIYV